MYKQIGILTGGGDAPGLNAVIRAVVRTAIGEYKMNVIGIEDSFEGILGDTHTVKLTTKSVSGILPRGGTILGTRNRGSFVKNVNGVDVYPEMPIGEAIANLDILGIEALIVLGGEGTLGIAEQFHKRGFPVIGVPKTIDNDLEATAMTFGFDSAVASVVDALDRLHTTATSHKRVMVLEVMGRHAGWIALHGGIAGGAHVILIPEIPFDYAKICEALHMRDVRGSIYSLVVVAEGARPADGQVVMQQQAEGEYRMGGIGGIIAAEIAARSGRETRCTVLGHLQRGGAPTTLDRILGTRFGVKAVNLIAERQFGSMVSYQNYQVRHVPIADAVNRLRLVPRDGELVQTARDVDISFGD